MASTGRQEQRGEKALVPHARTRSPIYNISIEKLKKERKKEIDTFMLLVFFLSFSLFLFSRFVIQVLFGHGTIFMVLIRHWVTVGYSTKRREKSGLSDDVRNGRLE